MYMYVCVSVIVCVCDGVCVHECDCVCVYNKYDSKLIYTCTVHVIMYMHIYKYTCTGTQNLSTDLTYTCTFTYLDGSSS